MLTIEMILARSKNGVIGKDNGLPWTGYKEDIKHFRNTIKGKVLVVGRKTYETLPPSIKRGEHSSLVIVITRKETIGELPGDNIVLANSLHEVMLHVFESMEPTMIVAGGRQVYDMFADKVHRVYVTVVPEVCDGDTTAPTLGDKLVKADSKELADGSIVDVYEHYGLIHNEFFKSMRWS